MKDTRFLLVLVFVVFAMGTTFMAQDNTTQAAPVVASDTPPPTPPPAPPPSSSTSAKLNVDQANVFNYGDVTKVGGWAGGMSSFGLEAKGKETAWGDGFADGNSTGTFSVTPNTFSASSSTVNVSNGIGVGNQGVHLTLSGEGGQATVGSIGDEKNGAGGFSTSQGKYDGAIASPSGAQAAGLGAANGKVVGSVGSTENSRTATLLSSANSVSELQGGGFSIAEPVQDPLAGTPLVPSIITGTSAVTGHAEGATMSSMGGANPGDTGAMAGAFGAGDYFGTRNAGGVTGRTTTCEQSSVFINATSVHATASSSVQSEVRGYNPPVLPPPPPGPCNTCKP